MGHVFPGSAPLPAAPHPNPTGVHLILPLLIPSSGLKGDHESITPNHPLLEEDELAGSCQGFQAYG